MIMNRICYIYILNLRLRYMLPSVLAMLATYTLNAEGMRTIHAAPRPSIAA